MKTNDQNAGNDNRQKENMKKPAVNQSEKDRNTGKKSTYIKDMPPIDGARPGVI